MAGRTAWIVGLMLLAAGATAAVAAHGQRARSRFVPPPELQDRRVFAVGDAADAVRLWRRHGVEGRRLVLLTGRWSRPLSRGRLDPLPASGSPSSSNSPYALDANGAIFEATRLGIARRADVVMPPSAFSHRLGEVKGQKSFTREESAFLLHYHGVVRRFSSPSGFLAPREPVIVLLEPSWFDSGAPLDPFGWLAARGVTWDVAVIALADGVATADQRREALRVAEAARAEHLEPAPE